MLAVLSVFPMVLGNSPMDLLVYFSITIYFGTYTNFSLNIYHKLLVEQIPR